jgi:hypothetical protein
MQSHDLKKYGFKDWLEIRTDKACYNYNKELILKLPREKGVYVIKANKPIGRLKGCSDIIYVGQGTIRNRIQVLIRSFLPLNFREYSSKHTARESFERVARELDLKLKLSYTIVKNPRETEKQLLKAYCRDHIEPPPLNNTRE